MSSTPLLDEYCALISNEGALIDSTPVTPTITSNDVLIVVDMQVDFLPGGSLGVPEGNATLDPIKRLVSAFAQAEAPIFFTRDYHPVDHCSFTTRGGPFNPHCVQGTPGSAFAPELAVIAQPLVAAGKLGIVYKGFSKDIDSFGSFPYTQSELLDGRVSHTPAGCNSTCWTGAFCLFSSNLVQDVSAPPDVMSVLDRVDFATTLRAKLKDAANARIFVVGLTLDFCVCDTAINAVETGGFNDVSILIDCTRAVHVPGGPVGSGFITSPQTFVARTKRAGVKLLNSNAFLPH